MVRSQLHLRALIVCALAGAVAYAAGVHAQPSGSSGPGLQEMTVTRLLETDVPDELYEAVCAHFGEEEPVTLTMAVVAINGWNRLAVSFGTPPGSYTPSEGPA